MKKHAHAIWIFLFHISIVTYAQEDVSFFDFWGYYSDINNTLYKGLCIEASDQLGSRENAIGKLKTAEDWLARQALVRKKLQDIIGPFPDKTPLNPQITGKLIKDGFTVEKIIYESMPGYFITGALFIPEGVKKNAPAIFYACGHSVEGFRAEAYQHIIINLVKKGFVVFTIDPMGQGERFEYWDGEKGEKRFPIPDHEHSYAGAQCLIAGYSTARYFIWDVIRGIDFLLTRKEVDPDRIGITGRSGGGNLAAYVAAIDDRIYAAAPECYITGYEYIYKSIGPQCAEQNLYGFIAEGLDHPDFIEARAPRPTMIISTTRDFFSIQGALETYKEAKKMYAALDAPDRLSLITDDTVHRSTLKNREAMYGFFQKHLNNPGSTAELTVEIMDQEELKITQTGQINTEFKGQSIFSLNKLIVRNQLARLDRRRQNPSVFLSSVSEQAVRFSGFEYPEGYYGMIFSGRFAKSDRVAEKYLIRGTGDHVIPAVLFRASRKTQDNIIVMIHTKGMEYAANQDSLLHDLLSRGHAVLLADLSGLGSMGPGYLKGDSYIEGISYNQWFAANLAGGSNTGIRVQDLFRITEFVKNEFEEFSSLSMIGIGPAGSELLYAATFDARINKVCMIRSFMSYADIGQTRFYDPDFIPFIVPGALQEYDLPDLIAGLSPRQVLIIDPLSGDGSHAHQDMIDEWLAFPEHTYNNAGVENNLNIIQGADHQQMLDQIFNWLDQ